VELGSLSVGSIVLMSSIPDLENGQVNDWVSPIRVNMMFGHCGKLDSCEVEGWDVRLH
jgi:hypothetical protein